MTDLATIRLFATHPHACSYLDNRDATTVFVDPHAKIDGTLYRQLSELGFRRSGGHVYRPQCEQCQACVPARIPAAFFTLTRSQRRCWRRNQDLSVRIIDNLDMPEYYQLYERYIAERHSDGDMYPASRSQFETFLTREWGITRYLELRCGSKLAAVLVCDEMDNALSAVYTFYDPDLHSRSLGTYSILLQIEMARSKGLDYLYLGYWIKSCPKMNYKSQFRPLELMLNRRWVLLK